MRIPVVANIQCERVFDTVIDCMGYGVQPQQIPCYRTARFGLRIRPPQETEFVAMLCEDHYAEEGY